jgi:hypothetical protein
VLLSIFGKPDLATQAWVIYGTILDTMFGKLKQYALKKVLQSQMKNVPADQQEMIMTMIEKDPTLFEKIAKEIQEELKKNGNNQMNAAMKVLPKYQQQILGAMSPEMKEKLMKMQMGAQGQFNPNGSIRK